MLTNTSNSSSQPNATPKQVRSQSGFTLMEMTVALLILMIGLLGLASAIGYGLAVSNRGRNVTNTKLLIVSVLEQMENLRNTKELSFGQIANEGKDVDNAGATHDFDGFPTGFQPVSINPGPDGIYGTTDDLVDAGADNTYGTADDFENPALARPGYERQIEISSLSTDLKKIVVTLRYPGGRGETQTMVATSYLNNDARSNFRP